MKLRPYQQEITDSVASALRDGGTGQVRMACGSGKTLVGIAAARRLADSGATVCVLVPSLALVAQALASWRAHHPRLDALAVCSDDTVADASLRADDIEAPVTTDVPAITQWLARPPSDSVRLVLGTYRSAHKLAEALRATRPADLIVFDEAHHLTGRLDTHNARLTDPKILPALRRLYMTATPRVDLRRRGGTPGVGMDDPELFGPVLGTYSFAQGIAEGHLQDYRLAVIGVADSQLRKILAEEGVEYVDRPGGVSLQTVAAQLALASAHRQFKVRSVLSFHARISGAAEFTRTLPQAVELVSRSGDGPVARPYSGHVHGGMGHDQRRRILTPLADRSHEWAVVSSARCLGEGVDLPAVDCVLFGNAKRSAVDIVQAVGRALRPRPDSDEPSTIIVPIIVPEQDGEVTDLAPGDYHTLWQVVRALRAHDDSLAAELDSNTATADDLGEQRLPSKITMLMPQGLGPDVLGQLKLMLVRQTQGPWWAGYTAAGVYRAEHGHLEVPATYVTDNGVRLGSWLAAQRYYKRNGMLPAERIVQLTDLGVVWEPHEAAFDRGAAAAAAYRAENGHMHVPYLYVGRDGYRLGVWLSVQRRARHTGALDPERIAELDALGMVWESPVSERWQAGTAAAAAYRAEHGHLEAPKDFVAPDGHSLGAWLNTQRQARRKGALDPERIAELDALGMVWSPEESRWQAMYRAAQHFHREHGHLEPPQAYVTTDGRKLGSWVLHQRQLHNGVKQGGLAPERKKALDALGMRWTAVRKRPGTA